MILHTRPWCQHRGHSRSAIFACFPEGLLWQCSGTTENGCESATADSGNSPLDRHQITIANHVYGVVPTRGCSWGSRDSSSLKRLRLPA